MSDGQTSTSIDPVQREGRQEDGTSVSRVEQSFQRIGKLRDGVITAASVLYLLGYLAWSFYAWKNNLGLLPVIQTHYFMAGVAPALFAVCCWLVFRCLKLLTDFTIKISTKRYAKATDINRKKFLRISTRINVFSFVFCFAAIIVHLTLGMSNSLKLLLLTFSILIPIFAGAVYTAAIFSKSLGRVDTRRHDYSLIAYHCVTIFLLGSFVYIVALYPSLPQELGGMRSRIAYLDLERAKVSEETREAMMPNFARRLPTDPDKDKNPVVRTLLLDVLYESNDLMLVRPHGAKKTSFTYQVKKDAIQGVTWCGYNAPTVEPDYQTEKRSTGPEKTNEGSSNRLVGPGLPSSAK